MKCPFCGTEHELKPHLNIICWCGGKYYFHTKEWWNRKTGEVRKPSNYIVHCKDCDFRDLDEHNTPVCTGPMSYAATPDDWFCAGGLPKGTII